MKHGALVLAILFAGCAAMPGYVVELRVLDHRIVPAHSGKTVRIQNMAGPPRNGTIMGSGAVISSDTVITAAHVVQDANGKRLGHVWVDPHGDGVTWIRADVVVYVAAPVEPVAVLRLNVDSSSAAGFAGFSPADCYAFSTGGQDPHAVVTQRGPYRWMVGRIAPGDSGSPVVDSRGSLLGLVWGLFVQDPVFLPVHAGDF